MTARNGHAEPGRTEAGAGIGGEREPVEVMREAVDAVSRFATRGCSGMMCDRVRGAWMAHQLSVIGKAATAVPDQTRKAYPDVAWGRLAKLGDWESTTATNADGLQAFVEHELPRLKRALRAR